MKYSLHFENTKGLTLMIFFLFYFSLYGRCQYDTCMYDTVKLKELNFKKTIEIELSGAVFYIDYDYFLARLKTWTINMKNWKKSPREVDENRDLKRAAFVSDSIYKKVKRQKGKLIKASINPLLELDFTSEFMGIAMAIEQKLCYIKDNQNKTIDYVIEKIYYKGGENFSITIGYYYLPNSQESFSTRLYSIR